MAGGYIGRKLLQATATILAIVILNFVLFRAMPGSPERVLLRNPNISAAAKAEIRAQWGLDEPLHVQLVMGIANALPLAIGAAGLFYAGSAICYVFVLGAAVPFLLHFGGDQLQPFLSVSDYLGLVMSLLLASGAMFELPLVLVILGRVGLVDARMLGRFRRYAIVVNAIVAAMLTPTPDAYTMLLMMLPLLVLYELSVVLVRIFGKPRAARVSPAPA
jgi:sec-independent protein translocase protein TatC